ncbi:DUF131 domain-containing protein [Candidatus Woesearchaeota archaeon]|nr:DUF131 domain-containing protein [Candidatus Woesearchaeota archaeon]
MRLVEIGIIVVLIGIIIIVIGSFLQKPADGKTKVAVGGLIGPIPFGFANDKRMLWFVLGIIALFVILQFVFWYLGKR